MNIFQGIIDIYYDNDIDFDDAWQRGIRAILHLTSRGTYKKDPLYAQRKRKALDMGFLWAGYHLISGNDPIDDQLAYFLSIEDGSDPRVGMAIDWENTSHGLATGAQVREFVLKYNQAMKPRYADRYPILYGGQEIRKDTQIQSGDPLLAKCPLWYVRYTNGKLEIPANTWPSYTLWQFDDENRNYGAPPKNVLPGADFNRFQGTEAELRAAWPLGGVTGGGTLPVHPLTNTVVAAAPAPVAGFAGRAVSLAIQEWDFFGKQTYDIHGHTTHSGHKEGEDGWYQRVGIYSRDGVHLNGLDGRNHDVAWSAAFISWLMRTAGAGSRFHYNERHSHYIYPAILAKRDGDTGAGHWCCRLNEAPPAVGDLICFARESGIDYDHQNGGDYAGHCDLVVEVNAGEISVIGGNVGDSVTRRPIALNSHGYLVQQTINNELLFGLMQNRIA